MSTQTRAYITPRIVRWARERARQAPSRLAERLNTNPERVMSWEQGDEQPTLRQAQQLARTLRIPFGYLFLSAPPKEELPIADLRTVRDTGLDGRPSPEFMALLNDVTGQATVVSRVSCGRRPAFARIRGQVYYPRRSKQSCCRYNQSARNERGASRRRRIFG